MSGLGSLVYGGGLFATLPDGSLVVGASHDHHAKLEIVLRRVNSDCSAVRSFGKSGAETLTVDSVHYGTIDAMVATPDGRLLLAGSDGRSELVGRLLASGRADDSFGTDGWTRFRPSLKNLEHMPEPLPRVATSIAFGPSGSIFLGGNDDTAHCCTQDFVSELTPNGGLVSSFGNDGSVVIPKMSGSYITEVAANGDGSVYAFVEYEQSGCGYPIVIRLRKDGSLDPRFDAAMAQTFRRVAPARWRFTPTLLPRGSGSFVLVGGFERSCPPFSHLTSAGLAVGVLPSGRIDHAYGKAGKTEFPSPLESLDSPVAVRLSSGRILLAGDASNSRGRLKNVFVRSFSKDGAIEGTTTIARAALPRYLGIAGLAPTSDGGAWLVISSRKEFELFPIH